MKITIQSFSPDFIKLLEQESNIEIEISREIISLLSFLILNRSQKN